MAETRDPQIDEETVLAERYIDLFLQNLTLWAQEHDMVNAGRFLPGKPDEPQ